MRRIRSSGPPGPSMSHSGPGMNHNGPGMNHCGPDDAMVRALHKQQEEGLFRYPVSNIYLRRAGCKIFLNEIDS